MGRLLAAVLLLSAACGDNLSGDPGQKQPGLGDPAGTPVPAQRWVPEVCGAREFTTLAATDPATDLALAPTPLGTAVLTVPRAGGTVTGFAFDDRMNIMTDPAGTKIPIAGSFTEVSASQIGGRLVSAERGTGFVRVNLLSDDLTNPQEIAKLPAGYVGKPAMLNAQRDRVVPIADATGLTIHQFDSSWNWIASKQVGMSKPSIGLATTPLGESAMVAWSTNYDCHIRVLTGFASGGGSTMLEPCASPRLAANPFNDSAVLVYEGADGVHYGQISHGAMNPKTQLVMPDTTNPRVVFDGQYYWVSFIDVRGDVVAGFINENGDVVTTAIAGTQPNGSYELALVNGHPWVFSVEDGGYSAHRLCIQAQW
jgi:hypothetical protein